MPTAAKLIAALALAGVGFLAAGAVVPYLPEGTRPGYLWAIAAAAGVLIGWRMLGPDARGTLMTSVSAGLRCAAIMTLVVLFIVSFIEMIERSLQKLYDGPMHALQSLFGLMLDYGSLILNPNVAGVLLVGGMLSGWLAHWSARRWR